MKYLMVLIMGLVLSACSIPKDPRISFGKKCKVTDDQVIWSHVWVYSNKEGIKANEEDCKFIPNK